MLRRGAAQASPDKTWAYISNRESFGATHVSSPSSPYLVAAAHVLAMSQKLLNR